MGGGFDRKPGGGSLVQHGHAGGAVASPGKRALTEQLDPRSASVAEVGGVIQRRAAGEAEQGDDVQQTAEAGVAGPGQQMPHADQIQASFGRHEISGVRAHVGGDAATAASALGANAYATGNDVAFASQPDLHTAAHEAAHVVQQRGGVQLNGGVGQAGDAYERHADAVADLVVQGRPAGTLLDRHAGAPAAGLQRQVQKLAEPAPAPTVTGAPAGPVVDVSNIQIEPWELVVPNSEDQHKFALFGHSVAYTVFISDADLGAKVRAIADRRAEKYLAAKKDVQDPEAFKEESSDNQFDRLKRKWVEYAGRVMYERSVGEKALNKLAADEKKLVASIKKEPFEEQQKKIAALRDQHAAAFKPELQRIKDRFVLTAEEEFKFEFESQNARAHRMARRDDDFEDADQASDASAVHGRGEVAKSVLKFAEELKKNTSTDIYTYKTHSWGRYSIDCEPRIDKDDNGWYEHDKLVKWFMAVDQAAKATKVDWNALYTNFESAKAANEKLGKQHVRFQWEHGPAPYVNHVHLDIRPDESHEKK